MINIDKALLKFKTEDPEKCDYITLMTRRAYSNLPRQKDGKCGGYRNKYYSDRVSYVCRNCINFDGSLGGMANGSL